MTDRGDPTILCSSPLGEPADRHHLPLGRAIDIWAGLQANRSRGGRYPARLVGDDHQLHPFAGVELGEQAVT